MFGNELLGLIFCKRVGAAKESFKYYRGLLLLMKSITIRDAQSRVRQFVEARGWLTPPYEIMVHLMEELGEIARCILTLHNYGGQHTAKNDPNVELDAELGDALYLLLKLANEYDIDLGTAFCKKMEHNGIRFPATS